MKLSWCAAALVLCGAVLPFLAVGSPQQSESEYNSILNDLLFPASSEASDAIALASADPTKACAMANHAAASIAEAQHRVSALKARMMADGEDVSLLDPLNGKIADYAPKLEQTARAVCDGTIAKVQTNPQTKDLADHIGGYMNAYTQYRSAAQSALLKGDMAAFCHNIRDGLVPLDNLTSYLTDLRKTTAFSPGDSAALEHLGDQVAGFKANDQKSLEQCATYP